MRTRTPYLLGLILIIAILGFGFYLEAHAQLMPCPLCLLQRGVFCVLGILLAMGALCFSHKMIALMITACITLTAIGGSLLAGRQIWLQQIADPQHECGVSLQYMLQVFPLNEVVQKIFYSTAGCVERGWVFLSLDMAEWSFMCFVFFIILGGYLFLKHYSSA